jgi:hypothetical protein
MGIVRATPDAQVAVTFDHIHMTRMEINQPVFSLDTQAPVYGVQVWYVEYGIEPITNIRHYKPGNPNQVGLNDFLATAMAKAATGNMALVNALTAIQSAVAAIITDQTGVATTVTA